MSVIIGTGIFLLPAFMVWCVVGFLTNFAFTSLFPSVPRKWFLAMPVVTAWPLFVFFIILYATVESIFSKGEQDV